MVFTDIVLFKSHTGFFNPFIQVKKIKALRARLAGSRDVSVGCPSQALGLSSLGFAASPQHVWDLDNKISYLSDSDV